MKILAFTFLFACRTNKQHVDVDNDGFYAIYDCNDSNPAVNPDADEICNEIDDDCDGLIDEIDENTNFVLVFPDQDGDGHGAGQPEEKCFVKEGYSLKNDDCDDANPDINPDMDETCNEIDDDCDSEIDELAIDANYLYPDQDGDGYGVHQSGVWSCGEVAGYALLDGDCDDDDSLIHPEAQEICDGRDNDCDGLFDNDDDSLDLTTQTSFYLDSDEDGWGDEDIVEVACQAPEGYVDLFGDCDDSDGNVNPDYGMDWCDGIDNDCDLDVDENVKAGWDLVSIDTNSHIVFNIDPNTATINPISTVSPEGVYINSMDVSEAGVAIVHAYNLGELWSIDACFGDMTQIGAHNVGNTCGIAFGPNGKLYGLDTVGDQLVEFDVSTGLGTPIGDLGFPIASCGLAYDCANNRLIGADSATDQIFTIDHMTGLAHSFVQTNVPFASVGLEYDPSTGELLASDRWNLYRVNPDTGATSLVGAMVGQTGNIDDLAYHPHCP